MRVTAETEGTDMGASSQNILVLMPCHNEAGRIGPVIRDVRTVLPDACVAVINDASTDSSPAEALAAGAHVLTHACNLGYGAALETGYLYAMQKPYAGVLQMDSDGQHVATELPRILAPLLANEADLVIGSRYGSGGPDPGTPPLRRWGHRVFAGLVRMLTGLRLTDPTSGFQALNDRAVRLFASGVFPCDYPDSDVILMAHMAGLRIREVPVQMRPRPGGVSMHDGWMPLYYGIKMLLAMWIVLLNRRTWKAWRGAQSPSPAANAG
jgi:hypothetical protein